MNKKQGFSLIEVMLAVLILGMAMTVFFSATSQGVDVVVRARGYQEGRELLHLLALREPLDLEDLEEGTYRGDLDHPEKGSFTWQRVIQLEGREEDQLFRVITTVEKDGDPPVRESIEEFLYLPMAERQGWVQEAWDEG